MPHWNGWQPGWPKRKRDSVGRWARSRRELTNGFFVIARGTVLQVREGGGGGFSLTSRPCESCKLQASISRVFPRDLDLLPKDWEPLCVICNDDAETCSECGGAQARRLVAASEGEDPDAD